ncbi:hypothetical protein A2318_00320 [Candidatus Uhrbacteria bacterium RIFOXYB2_FULL_45_11]|uniref:Uncharacterized protein n=1 Tax=Candidatus Uhrbacteria bacterium RIFOXYB2_FULL_45_11 TaxID=1802421 RepID=A0A1F7W722_9BACT|nr:MAG: hypothetical protein A2318_00320 [Candidatus Uhrbacteria bacterium RIFOXYB2_FULL_45_11]
MITLHHTNLPEVSVSKKKPIGFVGIIPKSDLHDAPVQKTVFAILSDTPTEPNEIGLGIFCLPANAVISLPKFVTSWIAFLPHRLVFSGITDPDDDSYYEIWFTKDVVCISDGAGDRETRFLLVNASEVSMRIHGREYLVSAHKTQTDAENWIRNKAITLFKDTEQQPS